MDTRVNGRLWVPVDGCLGDAFNGCLSWCLAINIEHRELKHMVLTAASRARNTELRMQLYDDQLCIYRALNVPQLADRSPPSTNTILLPINFSSIHNTVPASFNKKNSSYEVYTSNIFEPSVQ